MGQKRPYTQYTCTSLMIIRNFRHQQNSQFLLGDRHILKVFFFFQSTQAPNDDKATEKADP